MQAVDPRTEAAVDFATRERLQGWLGESFAVRCHDVVAATLDVAVHPRWSLRCAHTTERFHGRQAAGDVCSDATAAWARVNERVADIEGRRAPEYERGLLEVLDSGNTRAVWERSMAFGTDAHGASWFESCRTCGGRGDRSCSPCAGTGEVNCGYCSASGEVRCGACHGSGHAPVAEVDGRFRPCQACGGRGRVTCPSCRFSGKPFSKGKVTCTRCSGAGRVECSACGATGCFTHVVSIAVEASNDLRIECDTIGVAPWARTWIDRQLSAEGRRTGLRETLNLDMNHIRRQRVHGKTDVLTVSGSLRVGTGQLETRGTTRECRLVGRDLRPISYGAIADDTGRELAERICGRDTPVKELGKALGIPLCRRVCGTRRDGEDLSAIEPVRLEVISLYGARELLAACETVVGRFEQSRDTVGAGALLRSFGVWMGGAWIVTWAVAATHYAIDWATFGFGGQGLVLYWAQDLFSAVRAQEPIALGVVCGAPVLCYLVFRPFLALRRRGSFLRVARDVLGCLVVGLLLFHLTIGPILQIVAGDIFREPGLPEVLAGGVKAAAVLPELVLFSLLGCLLRVRAKQDGRVREQVTAIDDSLLTDELGY